MGTNYYIKDTDKHIGKTTCGIIGGEFIWHMHPEDFILESRDICDEYGRTYSCDDFKSKISLLEWRIE